MRACQHCGEIHDPALGACPKCGKGPADGPETAVAPGVTSTVKDGVKEVRIRLSPKLIAFIVALDLVFFGIIAYILLKK